MFVALLWTGVASADTWGPWTEGFVIQPREDAPIDAVLVYGANYTPDATATDANGNAAALASVALTGVGSEPRVALVPPEGGWGAGASWQISVLGYYADEGEVATLTFGTGSEPAPPPAVVEVGEVTVAAWSDDTIYPWGCCEPTRTVTVPITVADADPWSWVELVGQFDLGRPSQITTQEVHQHLDVAVGPGHHVLTFLQWEDERGPQPPCFDVVAVSASGVRGAPQSYCTEEPSAILPNGCHTTSSGTVLLPLTALILLAARRSTARLAR